MSLDIENLTEESIEKLPVDTIIVIGAINNRVESSLKLLRKMTAEKRLGIQRCRGYSRSDGGTYFFKDLDSIKEIRSDECKYGNEYILKAVCNEYCRFRSPCIAYEKLFGIPEKKIKLLL